MDLTESEMIGVVGTDSSRRCLDALIGIRRFATQEGLVAVDFGPFGDLNTQCSLAREWGLSGVISFVPQAPVDCLTVELFTGGEPPGPSVDVDPGALARAAFGHLRGMNPASISMLRNSTVDSVALKAWRAAADESQTPTGEFLITSVLPGLGDISEPERNRFRDWLLHLKRPAAMACETDVAAMACLQVLKENNLGVPEDYALITCENSSLASQLNPGLTGVIGAHENGGYEAARFLVDLVAGKSTSSESKLVNGVRVEVRGSTDRIASLPDDIRTALEFIRENACKGINVKDVMRTQNVSRVTFERRFKEFTGQTPGSEIRRIRIERAEELLKTTDMSVTQIAAECGFDGGSRFSLFFRKRTGMSPSDFRRRHR